MHISNFVGCVTTKAPDGKQSSQTIFAMLEKWKIIALPMLFAIIKFLQVRWVRAANSTPGALCVWVFVHIFKYICGEWNNSFDVIFRIEIEIARSESEKQLVSKYMRLIEMFLLNRIEYLLLQRFNFLCDILPNEPNYLDKWQINGGIENVSCTNQATHKTVSLLGFRFRDCCWKPNAIESNRNRLIATVLIKWNCILISGRFSFRT